MVKEVRIAVILVGMVTEMRHAGDFWVTNNILVLGGCYHGYFHLEKFIDLRWVNEGGYPFLHENYSPIFFKL